MKALKVVAGIFLGYVVLLGIFEIAVSYLQPEMDGMGITLSTTTADGETVDRVLAGVRVNGHLYVAANHWPRAWYNRALANPAVAVTIDGLRRPYTAVPVTGAELERIKEKYQFEFVLRLITGFAPRRFLRLDPA